MDGRHETSAALPRLLPPHCTTACAVECHQIILRYDEADDDDDEAAPGVAMASPRSPLSPASPLSSTMWCAQLASSCAWDAMASRDDGDRMRRQGRALLFPPISPFNQKNNKECHA